jgi:hypothetical protein
MSLAPLSAGPSTNTKIFRRVFRTVWSISRYLWNFVIYASLKCGENFTTTLLI